MFKQRSTELHLNASTDSFESYVIHDHESELDGSTVLRGGAAIPAECCKVQRKGRRLSEGSGKDEDDVSLPSTPELLDLCFEMENVLSSGEILPEAPPASSLMVQEVLDELEGSEATPPGISSEEALQANLEREEAAEKVSLPSSSVSSALFESEEAVSDAGLFDAHGFPSFEFHSISLGNQPSPGDAYTETSRASPLMVQEFFEDLEGEGKTGSVVGPVDPLDVSPVQSLKLPTLGLSVKRHASDDGEDDDEVAGPSSKVAKTDTTPSSPWSVSSSETKELSPSFAVDSTESGGFVSSVASSSLGSEEFLEFLNSLIPELEPSDAPPVPPSASADASTSSTEARLGQSSAPSGADTTVHPWLRVPDCTPGVGEAQFRPECLSWSVMYHVHGPLMAKIRELLVQPKLDQDDAHHLVMYSEFLANHAFHKMRGPVSSRRPIDAAEALGRRFMTFFLLHSASKALRQPWPQQQWWRDLASAIPSKCPFTPGGKGMNSASQASVAFAVQLSAAIELYKSGSAPENDEVVDVMRKLFCSPTSPYHFKTDLWDPWRCDDDPSLFST
ncbi:hypothetical protein Emed_003739 [Eimeria media]